MSRKHHVEELDLDDFAYVLLGNRISRLAKEEHGKERFRERRVGDYEDHYAPSPKIKRHRDKH